MSFNQSRLIAAMNNPLAAEAWVEAQREQDFRVHTQEVLVRTFAELADSQTSLDIERRERRRLEKEITAVYEENRALHEDLGKIQDELNGVDKRFAEMVVIAGVNWDRKDYWEGRAMRLESGLFGLMGVWIVGLWASLLQHV